MSEKITKSQKWLIQGQVEYFTAFTMLWISLLNYCREDKDFDQGGDTDKAVIDFLKKNAPFRDAFFRRVLQGMEEEKKALGNIAYELKRVDLKDLKGKRIDFEDLEATERRSGEKVGNECGSFVFAHAEEDIYQRFLDFVYQMRCHFIHGNLEPDHRGHAKLAKNAHLLLDAVLKEVINID